ncbi:hypothetical protein MASR2M48_31560 [Spirochaetota bacterium]
MIDTTKERILEATTALIKESGPEGLTVEAAADRAGVSRKTIYNHFNGKFDLIEGAASAWTDRILAVLGTIAADKDLPFVHKLNAIVERSYSELKDSGRMLSGPTIAAGPERHGLRSALQQRLYAFIEEIVQDAIDEGLVTSEFSARRLTFAILSVVAGLAVIDGVEDESFSRLDILKDSLKAFVGGILTPTGAEAMRGSPLFE